MSQIVGVGRCVRHGEGASWEFMLVVADAWQRRAVGQRLMVALEAALARRGATTVDATVLATNRGMLDFVQRLGYRVEPSADGPLFRHAVKELGPGVGMVGGTGIEPVTPRV